MSAQGAALWDAGVPELEAPAFRPGNLQDQFVAPPFSVLDTRQGYWQERRRAWLSLGLRGELGRASDGQADLLGLGAFDQAEYAPALRSGDGRQLVAGSGNHRDDYGTAYDPGPASAGISIFDPVLCELVYRWFAPEGGHVLDPFAGGSVRGIVASMLGHPYTGVDLSAAQLTANRQQAAAILGPELPQPLWLLGDSRQTMREIPDLHDLVFTCPPYYDLEVYSDDAADLSAAPTYEDFLHGYAEVWQGAVERLRPERFVVVVISEVRDPEGYYRGLVPDTIRLLEAAGARYYNEAILVNSAGTLPLRVQRYMAASRKLGRTHQNVLVFVRGKPPRGWSLERAAPPSPQLSLALEPEPVQDAPGAPEEALAPPVSSPEPVVAPEPAPAGLEPYDEGRLLDRETGELVDLAPAPAEAPAELMGTAPPAAPVYEPLVIRCADPERVRKHAERVMAEAGKRGRRRQWADAGPAEELQQKLSGYGAEEALAAHLGVPWEPRVWGARSSSRADIGKGVEVRWTRSTRALKLKPPARGRGGHVGDEPGRLYVLLSGDFPEYQVLGWAVGHEVMTDQYWAAEPPWPVHGAWVPGWVIPEEDLAPWPPPDLARYLGAPAPAPAPAEPVELPQLQVPGRRQAVADPSWDPSTWRPDDPNRRCWTCGSEPTHRFPDGSPAYSCAHDAATLALFPELETRTAL